MAIERLLSDDVPGVRLAYVAMVDAIRARALPTYEVSSRVRLTKTPEAYLGSREKRRELAYEALLANGRTTWSVALSKVSRAKLCVAMSANPSPS